MKCAEARPMLSPYLDSMLTGHQMRDLGDHLEGCVECHRQYTTLRRTQAAVASLGRKTVPPELALKLRVAISQEAARNSRNRWEGFRMRWENALNAFMVPATAGVLTAVVIFGLLIGFFAIPEPLRASNNDVPTMLYTPPQLVRSPFFNNVATNNGDAIIVEADIDAGGRVQNYRVLAGDTGDVKTELENTLIFTVFQPAMLFGRPTAGKAILSFAKVNVKG